MFFLLRILGNTFFSRSPLVAGNLLVICKCSCTYYQVKPLHHTIRVLEPSECRLQNKEGGYLPRVSIPLFFLVSNQ